MRLEGITLPGNGCAGQGIDSRSARQAVEIAGPHGSSGNRILVWGRTRLAVALIVNKEERVILAVVEMRDIDRPAEATSKGVEHFVLFFRANRKWWRPAQRFGDTTVRYRENYWCRCE